MSKITRKLFSPKMSQNEIYFTKAIFTNTQFDIDIVDISVIPIECECYVGTQRLVS